MPGEPYELRVVADGKLRRFTFRPETARFAWKVRPLEASDEARVN